MTNLSSLATHDSVFSRSHNSKLYMYMSLTPSSLAIETYLQFLSVEYLLLPFVLCVFPQYSLLQNLFLTHIVSARRLLCGMPKNIVELQWLEHLWDHDNLFETGEV